MAGILKRTEIINTSHDFSVIVAGIKDFLLPVYDVLANNNSLLGQWDKEKKMWDLINKL